MIKLNRMNGEEIIINADLIKFVEHRPDTIITFKTGEKLMIQNSPDEVLEKAIEYARLTRGLTDQVYG